ncbi:MAG: hypothetical protein R2909_01725 [Gemmatimonadales bacterium]
MDDREFEDLMREVGRDYPAAPTPPLETMWHRIEGRAFAPRKLTRVVSWTRPLALAATLVIGIGIGVVGSRIAGPVAGPTDPPAELASDRPPTDDEPSPFVGVAGDYLEQTTALLVAVTDPDQRLAYAPGTVRRARELLSTTRLLLDAGAHNPALRDLLQDLELVLAQVARTNDDGAAPGDAAFVSEALAQRDLLPRLTLFLADSRGDQ